MLLSGSTPAASTMIAFCAWAAPILHKQSAARAVQNATFRSVVTAFRATQPIATPACYVCYGRGQIIFPEVTAKAHQMAHDVFISYSSKDKQVADAVCSTLESNGMRCWIAPRDVLAGEEYAASLVYGLSDSRLMVLVFSAGSNRSPQVLREVERAVSKGLPILPLRIEDVPMSPAMEYYISSRHWLDALTPPLEQHLFRLCDSVKVLLSRQPDDARGMPQEAGRETVAAPAADGSPATAPEDASTHPADSSPVHAQEAVSGLEGAPWKRKGEPRSQPAAGWAASGKMRLWIGAGVILAVAATLLYFASFKGRSGPPPAEPNASGSSSAAPAVFSSVNNELLGAASSGDTAAAARLLGQGASVEAKNNQGDTPLLLAAKAGKIDTAELLIEKGANIEAKDNQGDTALIAACTAGHADMARLLVEKGAEIDARDDGGATPLMYAGLAGNTAIIDLLLGKGANINAGDDHGETPLMYAASAGSVDAVKLMLRKNANPAVKDRDGQTALEYAARWKRPDVVQLLEHRNR